MNDQSITNNLQSYVLPRNTTLEHAPKGRKRGHVEVPNFDFGGSMTFRRVMSSPPYIPTISAAVPTPSSTLVRKCAFCNQPFSSSSVPIHQTAFDIVMNDGLPCVLTPSNSSTDKYGLLKSLSKYMCTNCVALRSAIRDQGMPIEYTECTNSMDFRHCCICGVSEDKTSMKGKLQWRDARLSIGMRPCLLKSHVTQPILNRRLCRICYLMNTTLVDNMTEPVVGLTFSEVRRITLDAEEAKRRLVHGINSSSSTTTTTTNGLVPSDKVTRISLLDDDDDGNIETVNVITTSPTLPPENNLKLPSFDTLLLRAQQCSSRMCELLADNLEMRSKVDLLSAENSRLKSLAQQRQSSSTSSVIELTDYSNRPSLECGSLTNETTRFLSSFGCGLRLFSGAGELVAVRVRKVLITVITTRIPLSELKSYQIGEVTTKPVYCYHGWDARLDRLHLFPVLFHLSREGIIRDDPTALFRIVRINTFE